jgi:hypothetical protein
LPASLKNSDAVCPADFFISGSKSEKDLIIFPEFLSQLAANSEFVEAFVDSKALNKVSTNSSLFDFSKLINHSLNVL